MKNKTEFCFIVGRGRSGTTLLTSMLNSDDSVAIAPESLFIMYTYNKYFTRCLDKKTIAEFDHDVWLESRMENWGLNRQGLTEWLEKFGTGSNFNTICKIVYERYAFDHGKNSVRCVGDKNPHYSLFIKELIKIFPDAKFIHLVRDYRDNIVSYQNVPFDCNSVPALAYRWNRYNQLLIDSAKENPHKFFMVRYEDLVVQTKPTLQKICNFLNVNFTEQMLDFYQNKNELHFKWHDNLNSPVNNKSVGGWKKKLSEPQVQVAEKICGELGETLGYTTSQDPSSQKLIWHNYGILVGWLVTELERLVFKIPLPLRAQVVNGYRKLTGSFNNNKTNSKQ